MSTCLKPTCSFHLRFGKCAQPLLPAASSVRGPQLCGGGAHSLSFREQDCSVRLLWSGPQPKTEYGHTGLLQNQAKEESSCLPACWHQQDQGSFGTACWQSDKGTGH